MDTSYVIKQSGLVSQDDNGDDDSVKPEARINPGERHGLKETGCHASVLRTAAVQDMYIACVLTTLVWWILALLLR